MIALGANSGTANPDGFVRAGAIDANVGTTLFVQNSDTADDPAGMTVGDGGLEVTSTGSSPATVVAYGVQHKSDGSTVSGNDFFAATTFNGTPGFSNGSTFNGCSVGSQCGSVVPPPPPPPPPSGGVELILGPSRSDGQSVRRNNEWRRLHRPVVGQSSDGDDRPTRKRRQGRQEEHKAAPTHRSGR